MEARFLYRLAAGLSFLGLLAHELAGAPMVLPPLDTAGVPADVMWLHHFSWHVGSVAVLALAGMYTYASYRPNTALAFTATAMCAGFAVLGICLALFGDAVLWSTPAPYLWSVISVIGASGLLLENRESG